MSKQVYSSGVGRRMVGAFNILWQHKKNSTCFKGSENRPFSIVKLDE